MSEMSFDDWNEEYDKSNEVKERVDKAKVKKQAAKFEPTWEQVWKGYEKPNAEGEIKHKKGIWELKDSMEKDREWLLEVKQAVEQGKLGLIDPVTKESIPVGKFSKSKAKELYAVLEERKRKQRMQEIVDSMPSNYYCITETKQLEEIVELLKLETETGLDSETTGLDVYVDIMVGISITLPKADIHVYIPFGHTTGEKQLPRKYVLDMLQEYLEDATHKKFLHNAKFDKHMFLRHGYDIGGFLHCTQIAMKLLNENEPSHRLKDLLTKYKERLGFVEDSYTFEQLFGKKAKFHEVPLDVATAYACKDTHGCYLLGKWQEGHLARVEGVGNIFYKVESPLLPKVTKMERAGLLVDLEFGQKYGTELDEYLEKLAEEIKEEFGDVNLNSPQQMQVALYETHGLEDISGKKSTDKKTLEILSSELPILETILTYKDLYKLNSTYISALPDKIKDDGRIHGQFNQDTTDTGRFSSKEPNMQNLPPRARKLFIAPHLSMIVSMDFSQIEPRVLAHITGDEELRRPYKEGYDLYSTLASRTFKVPIEQCGDGSKYRKMMKTGLLAVMYGTSMWTLSKQLKITLEEAEAFIADFYEAYPKVKAWIESIWDFVAEHEYVETLYGRKRRFPNHGQQARVYNRLKKQMCEILGTDSVPQDFWNKKKYPNLPYPLKRKFQNVKKPVERVRRQAVNAIIQGSAADIMKLAMIEVDDYLIEKGWSMIATVHDEVLCEVSKSATVEELVELNDRMRTVVDLEVPLKTDLEVMETWGEGFKLDTTRKVFFHKDEKTGETLFETPDMEEAFRLYEEVS
jgi:DNA polymerase I